MKFKYLTLVVLIILASSCENNLDITPKSELTSQGFWHNEDMASTAHSGIYGDLRSKAKTLFLLGEMRSDIWGGPSLQTPSDEELIRAKFSVSNAPFAGWGGFYEQIHKINDFIEHIPNIDFNDEEEKSHYMGEVYGLRAFYYYTLLKTWGEVPLNTEAFEFNGAEGLSKKRASKEVIMQQIKEDIEKSLEYF